MFRLDRDPPRLQGTLYNIWTGCVLLPTTSKSTLTRSPGEVTNQCTATIMSMHARHNQLSCRGSVQQQLLKKAKATLYTSASKSLCATSPKYWAAQTNKKLILLHFRGDINLPTAARNTETILRVKSVNQFVFLVIFIPNPNAPFQGNKTGIGVYYTN